MGSLSNVVFYLAGPIDAVADDGVGWRREIRNESNKRELGIKFIDPSDKPHIFRAEVGHEKLEVRELKKRSLWKDVSKRVHEFARHDLRGVDISDCLLVHVDHGVHMCGSYFEVQRAVSQQKPKFLIIKGGKQNCPPWLFSIFSPDEMFDSTNDFMEYLEELSRRNLPEEWILLKDWVS